MADGSPAVFIVKASEDGRDAARVRDLIARHMPGGRVVESSPNGPTRADLARQAIDGGTATVVACGGDGTVSGVAGQLVGTDATLGIVPLGTANLVARSLGLPLDPGEAVRLIAGGGRGVAVDAMRTDEGMFVSHISLGVYAKIAGEESAVLKQRLGRAAYLVSLVGRLRRHEQWPFTIEADGTRWSVRASLVLLANVGQVGLAGMRWAEASSPTDGQLELVVVRGGGPWDYARLVWYALRGRPDGATAVHSVRQSVRITGPADMPVRGDGDVFGRGAVNVRVQPAVVRVIVPGR